jgi:hypothetical protein
MPPVMVTLREEACPAQMGLLPDKEITALVGGVGSVIVMGPNEFEQLDPTSETTTL